MINIIRKIKKWIDNITFRLSLKTLIVGSKKLKESENIYFIKKIKRDLIELDIDVSNFYLVKNSYIDENTLRNSLRQFIIYRFLSKSFDKSILIYSSDSRKNFSGFLPKYMLSELKRKKIKVSVISFLKNVIASLAWLMWGVVNISLELIELLLNFHTHSKKFTYFYNLDSSNFSNKDNIISHLIDNEINIGAKNIFHNYVKFDDLDYKSYKIKSISSPFKLILNSKSLFSFNSKKPSILIQILHAFFGSDLEKLFLNELLEFILIEKDILDRSGTEFFFHNVNFCYKPLWVESLESKGAIAKLYYYSTNIYSFDDFDTPGLSEMTWRTIYTFSFAQGEYLRKVVKNKNINIQYLQPFRFNFKSNPKTSTLHKKNLGILIFDVPPKRPISVESLSYDSAYYDYKNCKAFLKDIITSSSSEIELYLKPKRFDQFTDRRYLRFLKNEKRLNILDQDLDIEIAIDNSDAVICMPLTTPGIIGKFRKKSVVFYDSTGIFSNRKRYNDEPEILFRKEQLRNWILSNQSNAK